MRRIRAPRDGIRTPRDGAGFLGREQGPARRIRTRQGESGPRETDQGPVEQIKACIKANQGLACWTKQGPEGRTRVLQDESGTSRDEPGFRGPKLSGSNRNSHGSPKTLAESHQTCTAGQSDPL